MFGSENRKERRGSTTPPPLPCSSARRCSTCFGSKKRQQHAAAAAVQLCAPLQHVSDQVNGLPVQMMVPASHQAKPVPAAYQAFAVLDATCKVHTN
ncbi:unnamed protein product [Urochloa humidicola]